MIASEYCTTWSRIAVSQRRTCAQVFKAMHCAVEPIALKLIGGEGDGPSAEVQGRAMRELALLRDCRNPHIVQFLGASLIRGQVAIVTELMPLGDLHSALVSRRIQWGPRCVDSLAYISAPTETYPKQ